MVLLLVLFLAPVAALVAFYLYRPSILSPHRRNLLHQQTKEVSDAKPVQGETLPRRHVLFPELFVSKDTVYSKFKSSVEKYRNNRCFGYRKVVQTHKEKKVINGQEKDWEFLELSPYTWLSYEQTFKLINEFASGLRALGVQPKDNFGIYEDTRMEWSVASHACYSQSIVVLTAYANLGLDALVYALNQGELRYLLTNGKLLKTIDGLRTQLPFLKGVVYTDEADPKVLQSLKDHNINALSFEEVAELGRKNPVPPTPPTSEDLAVIMYTSGSTGAPKGVVIKHGSIPAVMDSGLRGIGLAVTDQDVYISYLPLAHILALVVENLMISHGVAVGFANARSLVDSEVRNCLGDLAELQPTLMAGVPTVWDRVKKGVLDKVHHASPLAKKLFYTAYEQKKKAISEGKDTPFWNLLVFNKIKKATGGRLRLLVSGGAPLSKETHEFLRVAICPNTIQGYGLTETTGGSTLQWFDDMGYQYVGSPLPCVEIKLIDVPELNYYSTDKPNPRGEVYIRGQSVTAGYYKNPETTKDAYKEGGWFATGDIAQWLPSGTLQIVDRRKNIVKLSHGEYIALELLESIFKNSRFVENLCICPRSTESFFVVIIVPSKKNLSVWGNVPAVDEAFLNKKTTRDHVLNSLLDAGRAAKLKSFELPKYVFLANEEWTPDNNMLTAAMKIKRIEIEKKFKEEIQRMYEKGHN